MKLHLSHVVNFQPAIYTTQQIYTPTSHTELLPLAHPSCVYRQQYTCVSFCQSSMSRGHHLKYRLCIPFKMTLVKPLSEEPVKRLADSVFPFRDKSVPFYSTCGLLKDQSITNLTRNRLLSFFQGTVHFVSL